LVKILLLLIGQGSRPLLLIGMVNLLILRRHILSMTNPTLLKTPAASQSTFIIGQLFYNTMDKVIFAKINRRITPTV
jgi:hypothetical protein